jgi:hypothetical protein
MILTLISHETQLMHSPDRHVLQQYTAKPFILELNLTSNPVVQGFK